jgi:hypothetical protein
MIGYPEQNQSLFWRIPKRIINYIQRGPHSFTIIILYFLLLSILILWSLHQIFLIQHGLSQVKYGIALAQHRMTICPYHHCNEGDQVYASENNCFVCKPIPPPLTNTLIQPTIILGSYNVHSVVTETSLVTSTTTFSIDNYLIETSVSFLIINPNVSHASIHLEIPHEIKQGTTISSSGMISCMDSNNQSTLMGPSRCRIDPTSSVFLCNPFFSVQNSSMHRYTCSIEGHLFYGIKKEMN